MFQHTGNEAPDWLLWGSQCTVTSSDAPSGDTAPQWPQTVTHICSCPPCVQGDVKGYLRSCRTSETMTPEPLILQRMACDIASGLLHMHKHNFTHR